MTVSKPVDFVYLVEQTLGWTPDPALPLWKARVLEAGKLNKAIQRNPRLYTWANLELAVEWCRRHKHAVTSPVAVCWKVERALEEANAPVAARPLGELIDAAIATEMGRVDDPVAREWIIRLTRASGNARSDVHQEWLEARQVSA